MLVVVLENPDRFAIRLTEQISSIGLFAVTESQCTEDEYDDEDEDDSKFGILPQGMGARETREKTRKGMRGVSGGPCQISRPDIGRVGMHSCAIRRSASKEGQR